MFQMFLSFQQKLLPKVNKDSQFCQISDSFQQLENSYRLS